jgi:hypothetical protein
MNSSRRGYFSSQSQDHYNEEGLQHAAFAIDGLTAARLIRFRDNFFDQDDDSAANLPVGDTSKRHCQCDPIGRRKKVNELAWHCRPCLNKLGELKVAWRSLKEKRHWYAKDLRERLKTARADAVAALFVLLNLLIGQSQRIGQPFLAEVEHETTHADAAANMLVYRVPRLLHQRPRE